MDTYYFFIYREGIGPTAVGKSPSTYITDVFDFLHDSGYRLKPILFSEYIYLSLRYDTLIFNSPPPYFITPTTPPLISP